MIITDEDSANKIFDTYEEALEQFNEDLGYAIIDFKIKGKKYWMVTWE